jgi:hypothetical protein
MLGRLLAALSYFGLTGALVPLAQPDNPFVVRHARRGIALHIVRIVLIVPVLALPLTDPRTGWTYDTLMAFAQNLSLMVAIGVPSPGVFTGAGGLWILAALIYTWGLQFIGMLLAVSGLTADMHAFLHADWPNYSGGDRRAYGRRRADRSDAERETKESLAKLREGRLARRRQADSVAAGERHRMRSLADLQDEFDETTARRVHLTKLLELGEISERRFNELAAQCNRRCSELATEIAILGARRLAMSEADSRTRRELPTDLIVHVPLQTLAITAHSGIPLFTYGTFHLDEALVTGILSAFNSLSEEVFGAQVHKTQLAEGQVLSFVHARYTVTMAVFDEEPSPVQLRLLRDLVDEFEERNAQELTRSSPNPARLREVEIPFTFATPERV